MGDIVPDSTWNLDDVALYRELVFESTNLLNALAEARFVAVPACSPKAESERCESVFKWEFNRCCVKEDDWYEESTFCSKQRHIERSSPC